jgi:hypothetical protein
MSSTVGHHLPRLCVLSVSVGQNPLWVRRDCGCVKQQPRVHHALPSWPGAEQASALFVVQSTDSARAASRHIFMRA